MFVQLTESLSVCSSPIRKLLLFVCFCASLSIRLTSLRLASTRLVVSRLGAPTKISRRRSRFKVRPTDQQAGRQTGKERINGQ